MKNLLPKFADLRLVHRTHTKKQTDKQTNTNRHHSAHLYFSLALGRCLSWVFYCYDKTSRLKKAGGRKELNLA